MPKHTFDESAPTQGLNRDRPDDGLHGFAIGRVLGGRYELRGMLGAGGMGEVWRAFDLKLRVDVALKALHPELLRFEHLKLLRREVRAAREVISPNVCRVFDLVEVDGTEMVSMELIDGETLLEVLHEADYTGYISVEVFDFKPDPQTIAGRSLGYLHGILESLGTGAKPARLR